MERASRRKYHYIYKTTCIINKRFYIGMHSTDNIEDGYVGSGKRLWHSINKHGKENHICEILEFLPDRNSLKAREKEIVDAELINEELCMNLMLGGEGGWDQYNTDGILQSKRGIKGNSKMKQLRETDENWRNNFSKKVSNGNLLAYKEGRRKLGEFCNWSGKTHSEETKRKIGKANSSKQKGENNSQYGKCWITNGIESKKIHKGDLITEGWKLGRKM
jgi:hypothetical protein